MNSLDISDLPPEVRQQLRKIAHNRDMLGPVEKAAVAIMEEIGGEVCLDEIIIQLWRRHQMKAKRTTLTAKLWRASQNGFVTRVAGKKGFYTAIATEAGTAETGTGSVHEGAGSEGVSP